jgi:Putative peptidoglycan binding domain
MEREILLRQLVETQQSVAESKGFIAQHQQLIVQSERAARMPPRPFACWTSYCCSSSRASKSARGFSTSFLTRLNWGTTKTAMKAVTFASIALALILASPGDAKDIIDISAGNPFVAPAPHPDRAHLKPGDSGGDVPILQKALNNHGQHLTVDGIFGRHTEKAVKDFQAGSGLETTGEVDSGTWSALAAKPAPVSNPARVAKQAAEEAKAQAMELAKQVASLNSELEKTNAQRNELQTKLDHPESAAGRGISPPMSRLATS